MRERGVKGVAFVVADVVDTDAPFWWEEVEAYGVALGWTPAARVNRIRGLKRISNDQRLAAIDELRAAVPQAFPVVPRLSGKELRDLESMGIEVGNHTASHPCLPMCDDETVEREIRSAHAALTAHLGHPPRTFAYPNGDHDPRAEAVLRELGYESAFLFDHRTIRPGTDPLRLSRLRVSDRISEDRFRAILNGAHPFVHHLLRRP
jgi:peptidoglycan/xylan/chitin deacetylase (PgdA/CDA1 family)